MPSPIGMVRPCAEASVVPNMRSRPKEKTTSSAVISSPLWKVTPWRSDNSTTLSEMRRHSVASPGTGPSCPSQSRPISPSHSEE